MVLTLIIIMLSYGISFYNSWAVGQMWLEAKQAGGFPLFYAWCGRIMAICGYTQFHVFLLGAIAYALGKLSIDSVNALISLEYLLIVFPVIGIGIVITAQSWAAAWRNRTFGNMAAAGWNTAATAYNVVNAFRDVPWALKGVDKLFSGKGKKDQTWLVFAIIVVAVMGGFIIDNLVVKASARSAAEKRLSTLPLAKATPRWRDD